MPEALNNNTILRAQAGDLTSISLLYTRHHPSVFRYLYYRVGDRQAAEDLTSEVFLRMLRYLAGYHSMGIPFQAWLFQIARNLAIDHFRKTSVSHQVELDDSLIAVEADPVAAAEHHLTSESLRLAMAKLSSDQRDVIGLRFVVGLPINQVAQTLKRSEDAIKALQRRGLIALREILAEKEGSNG